MATADEPVSGFAERSRRTQQHVLDAAVGVLVEFGYSGASTLRIQERAGVSRGRLLHQYPQRDQLLVAAVHHLAEVRVGDTGRRRRWSNDRGERIDQAVAAMWGTYHEQYFWAATELWLAARHNAALAQALIPLERRLGQIIRGAVDEMFGAEIRAHPDYPAVRDVLNASMRGQALTYSFEPRSYRSDPMLASWQAIARRELLSGRRRADASP